MASRTCYVSRNLLANAAISNRQAAVKGMPSLSNGDAESIMRALLSMRGYDKKKHLEAWEHGTLKVPLGDLKTQGTSHKWRTVIGCSMMWNIAMVSNKSAITIRPSTSLPDVQSSPGLGVPVHIEGDADEEQDDGSRVPVHLGQQLVELPPSPPIPLADWEPDNEQDKANIHTTMQLKDVICPTCGKGLKGGGPPSSDKNRLLKHPLQRGGLQGG